MKEIQRVLADRRHHRIIRTKRDEQLHRLGKWPEDGFSPFSGILSKFSPCRNVPDDITDEWLDHLLEALHFATMWGNEAEKEQAQKVKSELFERFGEMQIEVVNPG